jgi:hypothetical protein
VDRLASGYLFYRESSHGASPRQIEIQHYRVKKDLRPQTHLNFKTDPTGRVAVRYALNMSSDGSKTITPASVMYRRSMEQLIDTVNNHLYSCESAATSCSTTMPKIISEHPLWPHCTDLLVQAGYTVKPVFPPRGSVVLDLHTYYTVSWASAKRPSHDVAL